MIIIPFLLLCISINAVSQVDSLRTVWENVNNSDSVRFKAIRAAIWDVYMDSSPNIAIRYSDIRYDLARKLDSPKEMAGALNSKAYAFGKLELADSMFLYYRKSLTVSKANDLHIAQDYAYRNIAEGYKKSGALDSALYYFELAAEQSLKAGNNRNTGFRFYSMSRIYDELEDCENESAMLKKVEALFAKDGDRKIQHNTISLWASALEKCGQLDSAGLLYQKALEISTEINDTSGIAGAYENLAILVDNQNINELLAAHLNMQAGSFYQWSGELDYAVTRFFRASLLFEAEEDYQMAVNAKQRQLKLPPRAEDDLAGEYKKLGDLYWKFPGRGLDSALLAHRRCYELEEEEGDEEGMLNAHFKIVMYDFFSEKYDVAKEQLHAMAKEFKKQGNVYGQAVCLFNIGNANKMQEDYDAAIKYYQKSYIILERKGMMKAALLRMNEIADILNEQEKHEEALDILKDATVLAEKEKDNKGIFNAYFEMGLACKKLERYNEARKAFLRSLPYSDSIRNLYGKSNVYYQLAKISSEVKDYSAANNYWEKRVAAKKELNDIESVVDSYKEWGQMLFDADSLNGAIEKFGLAIFLFDSLGMSEDKANLFDDIASVFLARGDYDKAEQLYLEGIRVEFEMQDTADAAWYYDQLGQLMIQIGKGDKAREYLSNSLELRKVLDDSLEIGTAYHNLSVLLIQERKLNEAEECLRNALRILRVYGADKDLATIYTNLGNLKQASGYLSESDQYYRKSYEHAIRSRDDKSIAQAVYSLGVNAYYRKEFLQAVEAFGESEIYLQKAGDFRSLGVQYSAMGLIYFSYGDYEKAKDYQLRAVELAKRYGTPAELGAAYSNLASASVGASGGLDSALVYWDRSIELFESSGNLIGLTTTYMNQGYLLTFDEQPEKGIPLLRKGIKYADSTNAILQMIGARNQLGDALIEVDSIQSGLELILEAREMLEARPDLGDFSDLIRNNSENLADAYWRLGDKTKALKLMEGVVQGKKKELKDVYVNLPEREKESYLKTLLGDFKTYLKYVVLTEGENGSSFGDIYDNSLIYKGLTLRSVTSVRRLVREKNNKELSRIFEEWITLRQEIQDQEAKGNDASILLDSVASIEKNLIDQASDLRGFFDPMNVSWKEVRRKLDASEIAIEFDYYPGDSGRYVAMLIKYDWEKPVIVALSEIDTLLNELKAAGKESFNAVRYLYGSGDKGCKLYKLLWEPLEPHLLGVKKVYYSLTGSLNKVAFHAISDAEGHYLSDRFSLHQLQSTSSIASGKSEISKRTEMLLLGGAQYSLSDTARNVWEYLPGTMSEVKAISQIAEGNRVHTVILTGKDACEDSLKTRVESADIVHLSTHGYFFPDPDEVKEELDKEVEEQEDITFRGGEIDYGVWSFVKSENPLLRSGLALSGANEIWGRKSGFEGEDGVFTAQEVSNLDLSEVSLVVLSACETGLGDIKGAEGVYGLQRGFKMAGVKNMIVSLWQVPDEETAEFMTLFYQELFVRKDYRASFDAAQAAMRKKYEPYYWSAFVFVE